MSIALDLRTGRNTSPGSGDQFEKLLAWVRSIPDVSAVHVTLRGVPREPVQKQLQRTLLGMGCRITVQH